MTVSHLQQQNNITKSITNTERPATDVETTIVAAAIEMNF